MMEIVAETNESAIDIDNDGGPGNSHMNVEQQTQSSEQDEEVNLSEFPKELLEQILIHLDNKELLIASHVCKSFEAAAEMAFVQKYSKKGYLIDNYMGSQNAEKSFQKVMLTKYGAKIQSLLLIGPDEEISTLVEQKCCSLKSVNLDDLSKMPMLSGLKKITFSKVQNVNRKTFAKLITNNPELESLHIDEIENNLLEILDGRVNMLKCLTLDKLHSIIHLQKIRLRSLEALSIKKSKGCTRMLIWAMNSNAIKELNLKQLETLSDGLIHEICSLKTLDSLRLHECLHLITKNQLQKLGAELPHLTEFGVKLKKDDSPNPQQQILSLISMVPKLIKLKISLDGQHFYKFLNDLMTSIYDFHACFADTGVEIEITYGCSKVTTSKDRIFIDDASAIGLHWMNNFNEKNLRKSIHEFRFANFFGLVNNCADQIFDISTLLHSKFEFIRVLDIKSTGPITVNANVTRYLGFLPRLTRLKIHLENHTAMDFLEKCDKHFCERIEELRLNTNGILGNQEGEQGADLTSLIAKFENLKSLHLNSASGKLDTEHLFSSCPKLKNLQVWRE